MRVFGVLVSFILCILAVSCGKNRMSVNHIAENEQFIVTGDSVIEGNFVAYAASRTEIFSNYISPNSSTATSPLPFRLAFNMRDNELQPGLFHIQPINGDTIFAKVGEHDDYSSLTIKTDTIRHDTNCTFRVDLTEMEDAFDNTGYYVTATNDTIYRDEFNGVWIIGNIQPLSWDLTHLASNNKAKLRPTNQRGIYELDVVLNPTAYQQNLSFSHWSISEPNKLYPIYTSQDILVDAVHNMAIDAIHHSTFAEIPSSHISLAIFLSLAQLNPDLSERLLRSRVKNNIIEQDANNRFAAPIVNDRLIWAAAAWKVYCANGNKKWLQYAYNVIQNTINSINSLSFCNDIWLTHGCDGFSSPEAQYPRWMTAKDYFESIKLSTNCIYAYSHHILALMAEELEMESENHEMVYERMKDNINQKLWNERKGRYCSYLMNEAYPVQSATTCNLAQSLCMLFNIAEDDRAQTLLQRTPFYNTGIPTTFPADVTSISRPEMPYVQAMWNIAAAQNGNENLLRHGLGALYRSVVFNGFRTTKYSPGEQLLNACSTAAIAINIIAGINVTAEGIELNPFIPECFQGAKTIKGIAYRNAIYDITYTGFGNEIESIMMDGAPFKGTFLSNKISGYHKLDIKMTSRTSSPQSINHSPQKVRPFTPSINWSPDSATINNYNEANNYSLIINGKKFSGIHKTFAIPEQQAPFNIAYVVANDGHTSSFISKPHYIYRKDAAQTIAINQYALGGTALIKSLSASKYVEMSNTKNNIITLNISTKEAGEYYLDLHYSNGTASSSTCPMCKVSVNTHYQGTFVMPGRGNNEWRNFGFTNMVHAGLLKGKNSIRLEFVNNSKTPSTVLLHNIRIIKR